MRAHAGKAAKHATISPAKAPDHEHLYFCTAAAHGHKYNFQISTYVVPNLPMGVTTRLVVSTPAQAESMRCCGVMSIGTGAAAISSDKH